MWYLCGAAYSRSSRPADHNSSVLLSYLGTWSLLAPRFPPQQHEKRVVEAYMLAALSMTAGSRPAYREGTPCALLLFDPVTDEKHG